MDIILNIDKSLRQINLAINIPLDSKDLIIQSLQQENQLCREHIEEL